MLTEALFQHSCVYTGGFTAIAMSDRGYCFFNPLTDIAMHTKLCSVDPNLDIYSSLRKKDIVVPKHLKPIMGFICTANVISGLVDNVVNASSVLSQEVCVLLPDTYICTQN